MINKLRIVFGENEHYKEINFTRREDMVAFRAGMAEKEGYMKYAILHKTENHPLQDGKYTEETYDPGYKVCYLVYDLEDYSQEELTTSISGKMFDSLLDLGQCGKATPKGYAAYAAWCLEEDLVKFLTNGRGFNSEVEGLVKVRIRNI